MWVLVNCSQAYYTFLSFFVMYFYLKSIRLKKFILIATLLCSGVTFAQPNKDSLQSLLKGATFEEKFRLGDGLMLDLFYSEALMIWDNMLADKPTNAHLNYRAGLCLVSMNRESDALTYFEKAQYGVSAKFDPYSSEETHAPPEVYFFLAHSNHVHGNIDTAYYQYKYFLSNIDKKHDMYKAGELGIAQLKVARMLMAKPKQFRITDLGDNINTSAPEYSPVVTIDGSALFFTTKRLRKDSTNKNFIHKDNGQYFEDIYVSYRDSEGNWSEPNYLHFSGAEENNASVSTSPDGQKVFVYEGYNGGDIYFSKLKDTTYSHPEPLSTPGLNTEYWEPHLTINAFEDEIYFVSDRPGGYGGRDIYRIVKLPDGNWSQPYNLPPPINSEYEEDAPFIGADNRTLYFSSNGPNSMGGFDIFMAHKDEDGIWSAPINMGYPLNSVDDDVFYTTTADGLIGFYSSDKLEGKGDKDIYMVETEESLIRNIAILKGLIYLKDSSMIPSGITIHVRDITEGLDENVYSPRRRDGGYVLALRPCHNYQIDYRLDGKTFHQSKEFVPCNTAYQEIQRTLLLDLVNLEVSGVERSIPIGQNRWEFANPEHYDILAGKKVTIFEGEEDNLIQQDSINEYGQFSYRELNTSKSHRIKIDDIANEFCEDLVLNLIDTSDKVIDTYTFKFDCESNPSVQEFSETLNSPIFQFNFLYNDDKFTTGHADLNEYVRGVKEIVEAGKEVTILVSASASRVPTKKYKNNMNLAMKRLETGKKIMQRVLKKNKIDLIKVKFQDDKILVGGPNYKNDAVSNAKVYEKYQYIKFEVRF